MKNFLNHHRTGRLGLAISISAWFGIVLAQLKGQNFDMLVPVIVVGFALWVLAGE